MKTILTLLALGGGLLSCTKEYSPSDVAATANQPFVLEINQTATVPTPGGSTVRVVLAAINDSRCPSDMNCFVAGFADVDVKLTDASATTQPVHLGLGYGRSAATADSALVTLNQRAYWLRLLAVNPYPAKATAGITQTATLRLRAR